MAETAHPGIDRGKGVPEPKWGRVDAPGETGRDHYCPRTMTTSTSTKSSYNYIWKKAYTAAVKRK